MVKWIQIILKGSFNMPNINDYIKWRGDLELKISEFNEIDSLILSRFSYLPFESLMEKEEELNSIEDN